MPKIETCKRNSTNTGYFISCRYVSEKYLKACDAQGYLAKPFEQSNLIKIIQNNLN